MSKFTLALNSHALSDFQKCEGKYKYSHLIGIEPCSSKISLDKGTLTAKWLQIYYENKISPRPSRTRALAFAPLWLKRMEKLSIPRDVSLHMFGAWLNYATKYKDESWKPIGTELGFSKILYEDNENLFVYEGRPDLLVQDDDKLIVVDHKTQSMKYDIYPFNNQARGYLWAADANEFCYNYIVFNKYPEYRRTILTFTPQQIDDWKSNTIEWFFRVKHSTQKKSFPLSWNCESKFGVCQFHALCEQPQDMIKMWLIRTNFKPRKVYRSW